MTDKPVNPETGIYFIRDWGYECARGFVRDQRFNSGNDQVIKPTNRTAQRKQRQLAAKLEQAQDWKSKAAG